ncbi:hypothetical protein [Anabaena azotica]|uniref:Uncharacterized protein n=1 Tax=Anabaena azotica FACHB-119 TaxID=947527 RepID=A0ABR8D8C9_9NOST|nr:hypothetical protein [Anabaena azotica]MBD2503414.1 hypothetical protein [Anabaena azotica FACHB-119]
MEPPEGRKDLNTDYLWMPRVNTTVIGKTGVFQYKFNNPTIAVLADTTNINPSNIAGYLTQISRTQLGLAEVGNWLRLPNKVLRIYMLPNIINYQVKFTLATPVGNCKVQVWEGISKASL